MCRYALYFTGCIYIYVLLLLIHEYITLAVLSYILCKYKLVIEMYVISVLSVTAILLIIHSKSQNLVLIASRD